MMTKKFMQINYLDLLVGEITREESEEYIKKLMKDYKEYEYGDYWSPVKDESNE